MLIESTVFSSLVLLEQSQWQKWVTNDLLLTTVSGWYFFYTPDQWRANSWIRMFLSVCSFQSCADVYLTLKAFQSMTELEKLRMLLRKVSGRLESNRTVKIEANSALQDLIILHIIQKPNRIIVFNEWKKKIIIHSVFYQTLFLWIFLR